MNHVGKFKKILNDLNMIHSDTTLFTNHLLYDNDLKRV
jgi:hypothetical protein